jgi:serine/threonine protein kinase
VSEAESYGRERWADRAACRYRNLGLLGRGGMGTVFKAEHQRLERLVVLKVVRKEPTARLEAVEHFCIEAKAAARLLIPTSSRL